MGMGMRRRSLVSVLAAIGHSSDVEAFMFILTFYLIARTAHILTPLFWCDRAPCVATACHFDGGSGIGDRLSGIGYGDLLQLLG